MKTLAAYITWRKATLRKQISTEVVETKRIELKKEPRWIKTSGYDHTAEYRSRYQAACAEHPELQLLINKHDMDTIQHSYEQFLEADAIKEAEKNRRRHQKAEELRIRQEIDSFAEHMLTESFLHECILSMIEQCMTHYYSSERVHVFDWTPYGYDSHMLKAENMKQFIHDHTSEIPNKDVWEMGRMGLCRCIYQNLISQDCCSSLTLYEANPKRFELVVVRTLNRNIYSLVEQVRTVHFPLARIMELVESNKVYRKAFAGYREWIAMEESVQETVLHSIPEHNCDLFPQTRKMRRHFVLHLGPANSGKTHDALQVFYKAEHAVYLAPLRLLAYEICTSCNALGFPCSLITGEERSILPDARHVSMTVEMADLQHYYDAAVIDECQLISDPDRGGAWTAAILGIQAEIIHLCASSSAELLLLRLIKLCGDTFEVHHSERLVPLKQDPTQFQYPASVQPGDALIVFSRTAVIHVAAELQNKNIKCSVIYGALPYEARCSEVNRFLNGETSVVVATDAIGMGMNLPVRRIVFLEARKYDGSEVRELSPAEVKQIAGRAGRYGILEEGLYTAQYDIKTFVKKMELEEVQNTCAYVRFPARTLSGINGPLSVIIKKWYALADEEGYLKEDISDKLQLCEKMEALSDRKDLIAAFLSIGFNTNNESLAQLYLDLFRSEVNGIHCVFDRPKHYDSSDLSELEELCQFSDLMYAYLIRFSGDLEAAKALAFKKQIAKRLISLLKTRKFKERTCRYCGEPLPWNYPYGICQDCYDSRHERYEYDY